MSRIRTNLITNRMANGAPTVSNGLVISGVTTTTTLDVNGDLDVDGHLNADNVSIAGVVTATTFSGSGASLTNLPVPTTITVADESTDTTCNPLFVTTTSGNLAPKTGTNLTFNSSSGNLRTGSLFLGTATNESKTQDGLILERNSADGEAHITAGRSGGNYSGMQFYVAGASGVTKRHLIDYQSNFRWYGADGTTEMARLTGTGRFGIGTASPQKQLQIIGDADTCLRITSSAGGVASLQLGDTADTVKGAITFKNDDNSLRIRGHNNADRIVIDSSGNITKPNQPLFVAQKSGAITGTGFVTFDTVIENVGSHYDSSNGRFTAPVAGYYWFCCKINAYKRIDFYFKRNGSNSGAANREIGQFNTSNQDGWYSHNLIRIFELAANDYVQVDVTVIHQNSDPGEWITFQGYLLQ